MRKDIVVIGVGGTSRDILDALEAINAAQSTWNILGFLDDNPALHGQEVYGYGVLGSTDAVLRREFAHADVVIGVANDRRVLDFTLSFEATDKPVTIVGTLPEVREGEWVDADGGWQPQLFNYINLFDHMDDFARGILDTRPVIFYASLTMLFLFLTLRAVESRRWK